MAEKARVAVVECPDYRPQTVLGAMERIFRLCEAGPAPGPLLFKPNMLSARTPGEAVTTHPAVVEAACRLFPVPGSVIGDSPANSSRPVEDYWAACGYRAASERTGVPLSRFGRSRPVRVEAAGQAVEIPVAGQVFDHFVFNLPKLKTHGLTAVTGPVKNLYGVVPGYSKSLLHGRFVSADDFCSLLAALYRALRDRLFFTVVDAVTVMEGNGPANGTPRHAGFLLGGRDAVACERACLDLLGVPAEAAPVMVALGRAGIALPEPEIVGDRVRRPANFRLPAGHGALTLLSGRLAGPAGRFLGRHLRIRPEIDRQACRRCGLCREACPREAIGDSFEIERNRCIDCLCCFEVCPHRAVALRRSFLARFLR